MSADTARRHAAGHTPGSPLVCVPRSAVLDLTRKSGNGQNDDEYQEGEMSMPGHGDIPVSPRKERGGCEVDGYQEDQRGAEHYWHCEEPGVIDVEGTLMCAAHAGERGYGPRQEEYGFDPGPEDSGRT